MAKLMSDYFILRLYWKKCLIKISTIQKTCRIVFSKNNISRDFIYYIQEFACRTKSLL